MEEWKNFEEKMKTLPLTDKDARAFVRFFFAGATECEVDKQGRILIAQNLREYASIDKDVYVIGMAARVEVWDKSRWEEYQSGENLNADKLAEKLSMLGMQL